MLSLWFWLGFLGTFLVLKAVAEAWLRLAPSPRRSTDRLVGSGGAAPADPAESRVPLQRAA